MSSFDQFQFEDQGELGDPITDLSTLLRKAREQLQRSRVSIFTGEPLPREGHAIGVGTGTSSQIDALRHASYALINAIEQIELRLEPLTRLALALGLTPAPQDGIQVKPEFAAKPAEETFIVSFPDVELRASDVWTDGNDMPENPTAQDVIEEMREYGSPGEVACAWELIDKLYVDEKEFEDE